MNHHNKRPVVLLGIAVACVTGLLIWQGIQLHQLEEKVTALNSELRAEKVAQTARWTEWARQDTRPTVELKVSEPQPRPKSKSESHGPRGPMPVSLAVESDRQPHDPPPGSDVTSEIRVKNTRPCETACQRLSRCAMDLPECQSADTRSQHDFVENCYQECRKSQKVKGILLGETDCQRALDEAQTSLDGFTAWCGRP